MIRGYIIDVGSDDWSVIKVTHDGWEIVHDSPVKFWRPNPMRPLPIPAVKGDINKLWDFANIPVKDRPLVLAFIIEAWRAETPFPILELVGVQGTAKSSTQDKLRRLIDPNAVNLRSAAKTTEDLFIGAGCNWLVSLNNLSHLSSSQQDALCNLATGGGFASRTLYTNSDETIIECKRPVVINGIVPLVTAQDLTDRVLHIELEPILEYREESEIEKGFVENAPLILGALLDLFVATLARLPQVKLKKPPRMSDFARLGEAMCQAIGYEGGAFIDMYAENRNQSIARGLDASPVATAILQLAGKSYSDFVFEGTMKSLLDKLDFYRSNTDAWPKSPRGLGDVLRRQSPALKSVGVDVSITSPKKDGVHVFIKKISEPGGGGGEHGELGERHLGVIHPEKIFSDKF